MMLGFGKHFAGITGAHEPARVALGGLGRVGVGVYLAAEKSNDLDSNN